MGPLIIFHCIQCPTAVKIAVGHFSFSLPLLSFPVLIPVYRLLPALPKYFAGLCESFGAPAAPPPAFFHRKKPLPAGRGFFLVLVSFSETPPPEELGRVKKLSLPAPSEAGRDEQLYDCQKDNLGQTAPVYGP